MMPFTNSVYTANMNPQQRAWFYAEYEHARKDEIIGILIHKEFMETTGGAFK